MRNIALALALTTITAQPAFAETCNLTVLGRQVLDDEPCTVSTRGRAVEILQEGAVSMIVRGSVLQTNLAGAEDLALRHRRRRGFTSLGQVVKSNTNDDKVCYFNQRATLCIER